MTFTELHFPALLFFWGGHRGQAISRLNLIMTIISFYQFQLAERRSQTTKRQFFSPLSACVSHDTCGRTSSTRLALSLARNLTRAWALTFKLDQNCHSPTSHSESARVPTSSADVANLTRHLLWPPAICRFDFSFSINIIFFF